MRAGVRIDLCLVGDGPGASAAWPFGAIHPVAPTPAAVHRQLAEVVRLDSADAVLLWSPRLGPPDADRILSAVRSRGDLWHAGLRLGTGGHPGLMDFIAPAWTFVRDPTPAIPATSWRASLEACVVPLRVLRECGLPDPSFVGLMGSGLEWGLRCLQAGAFIRHDPDLIGDLPFSVGSGSMPLADEIRLVRMRFSPKLVRWGLFRALATGYMSPRALSQSLPATRGTKRKVPPGSRRHEASGNQVAPRARVSVVIPTLDRQSELRRLLGQLAQQTVPAAEVIIVDQAAPPATPLHTEFPELPIRWYHQGHRGQCSSRNAAVRKSRGDVVLFLDDDDEIDPTLIADHLENLTRFSADVSSGVANETADESGAEGFENLGPSPVFPTNNSMVRKSILSRTGLFDLAYETSARADGDFGMRLYLAGALMVLDPRIEVFHRHSPRGGLRAHGARVVTFAASRKAIGVRHLPSTSELYLSMRYFTTRQVKETKWLRVASTFVMKGGGAAALGKAALALLTLPHTVWVISARSRDASRWLRHFPQIPMIEAEQELSAPITPRIPS